MAPHQNRLSHHHHPHQRVHELARGRSGYPDRGRENPVEDRMDYTNDRDYNNLHNQVPHAKAAPLEPYRYTPSSTKLSTITPRSIWEDFPGQWGRPISPDSRRLKYGARELDDVDLRRYKREPSAHPERRGGENWKDVAEDVGTEVVLQVMEEVLLGKLDVREEGAYGALQHAAACRGQEISGEKAVEWLEKLIASAMEEQGLDGRAVGSLSLSRDGYAGHYGP